MRTFLTEDWCVKSDIETLIEIDNSNNQKNFDAEQYHELFLSANISCRIFKKENQIVGYIIYSSGINFFNIVRIAVHKKFESQGIGTYIIDYLKSRLIKKKQQIVTYCKNKKRYEKFLLLNGFEYMKKQIYRFHIENQNKLYIPRNRIKKYLNQKTL